MYTLPSTQIIENALSAEQVSTLAKQHGYYVTYEEDKLPFNAYNTRTVPNMPPAPNFAATLGELVKAQYLTTNSNLPDIFDYTGCRVELLNFDSTQPPTKSTPGIVDLCLQICLQYQGPRPLHIVDTVEGTIADATTKYDLTLGQGILWLSSGHIHYRPPAIRAEIEDINVKNIYVTYMWSIQEPLRGSATEEPLTETITS